jgi:hypothetical protein
MPEHRDQGDPIHGAVPSRRRWWIGFGTFAVLAVVLLREEHQAHLLGALPWLILLACPLLHRFMHGGYGHGGRGGGDQ